MIIYGFEYSTGSLGFNKHYDCGDNRCRIYLHALFRISDSRVRHDNLRASYYQFFQTAILMIDFQYIQVAIIAITGGAFIIMIKRFLSWIANIFMRL